jgi:hypothetical protein
VFKPVTSTTVAQGVHTITVSLATNVRRLAIPVDAGVDRIQFVAISMLQTQVMTKGRKFACQRG